MAKKRVLIILSEWGFWGEELIGPLEAFDQAGYEVDFATLRGKRPVALPPSTDEYYSGSPLGRSVTSAKVRAIDKSPRLDNPINISEIVPERPCWSSSSLVRDLEAYYKKLDGVERDFVSKYDTMLLVGGSDPVVDCANDDRVHSLILLFQKAGKPMGAECYGVACLALARELQERKSIIRGKRVTGHCKEYDHKDCTGFMGADFNVGPPPYPLEHIQGDATGPDGAYIGKFGHETSVIVDYPFIAGSSTPDSYLTGQKMVEVLEKGFTRWDW